MDSKGCETWFREVFIPFIRETVPAGERVALLWDNFSGHSVYSVLNTNIDVHPLPPNSNPIHQPLDQGIIRTLKAYYKSGIARSYLHTLENRDVRRAKGQKMRRGTAGIEEGFPPTIADAMDQIEASWKKVSATVIQKCWKVADCLPFDPEVCSVSSSS